MQWLLDAGSRLTHLPQVVKPNVTIHGPRILLRPVDESDLGTLVAILREPSVAEYWTEPDDIADLLSGEDPDGAEAITTFAIEHESRVIGWIGGWEKLEPEYRHAGIDLFIATSHQRRGLGSEAIALVCRFLFETRGHHRIVIDPAASNSRAIAAYEKIGFRRVGIMRQYERGKDGTFHDGVLLDLLASDLQ